MALQPAVNDTVRSLWDNIGPLNLLGYNLDIGPCCTSGPKAQLISSLNCSFSIMMGWMLGFPAGEWFLGWGPVSDNWQLQAKFKKSVNFSQILQILWIVSPLNVGPRQVPRMLSAKAWYSDLWDLWIAF
jgi:hypothetical protein